jgi:ABC-type phosphate transport system permease subunit
MNKTIARIALPIVSAGILGGAALGLAGVAGAAVTTTQNQSGSHTAIVATPDTFAKPATSAVPGWRFHHGHGHAYLGQ